MKYLNSLLLILFLNLSFSQEKIKVDGISSVVGDFIILDSDIDKVLIDMESQGLSTRGISRCQLLGKLMEDKLYAHHAIQDSLELSDNEIYDYVDRQIDYFTEQLGGIEKVLEFYNKRDELSFRDELFEINKTQRLSEMMQQKIVEKVEITPEESGNSIMLFPELIYLFLELNLKLPKLSLSLKYLKKKIRELLIS